MHHIYSIYTHYSYFSTCFDLALTVIRDNLSALYIKPLRVTQLLSMFATLVKGKAIPLQGWTGPEASRRLRLPDFKTISTLKVIRYSAHAPADFTPQEILLVFISVRE
jgi:hypothetical protein